MADEISEALNMFWHSKIFWGLLIFMVAWVFIIGPLYGSITQGSQLPHTYGPTQKPNSINLATPTPHPAVIDLPTPTPTPGPLNTTQAGTA